MTHLARPRLVRLAVPALMATLSACAPPRTAEPPAIAPVAPPPADSAGPRTPTGPVTIVGRPVDAKVPDGSCASAGAALIARAPDVCGFIHTTESMDRDERAYWMRILPVMTEQQVAQLISILDQERAQLLALDGEYAATLRRLNEKHEREWEIFEAEQRAAEAAKARQPTQAAKR